MNEKTNIKHHWLLLLLGLVCFVPLQAQKNKLAKNREGESMTFETCEIEYCEAAAGLDKIVCEGIMVTLQAESICPDHLYRWLDGATNQYLGSGTTLKQEVFVTTTFVLEVVAPVNDIVTRDEVIITVLINDSYPTDLAMASEDRLSIIQVPPEPDGFAELLMTNETTWGLTYPETYDGLLKVEVDLCSDGEKWHPILKNVEGPYSIQYRLLPGVQEVTGIGGNTVESNHCEQIDNMDKLSLSMQPSPQNWYVLEAVKDHEEVHLSRFLPSLLKAVNVAEGSIETPGNTIIDTGQDIETAKAEWQGANYAYSSSIIYLQWKAETDIAITNDHGAGSPTEQAERAVVVPIMKNICCHSEDNAWTSCTHCTTFISDCE